MNQPVIRALLGNSQHPEYGSATIPFPLSREEYPNSLELLSALEIGDAVGRDCTVLSIQTEWTSLGVLEGQCVNVDELDYLAKRLNSFSKGETAQFEGMADLLKLKDIKDLINLTFCCQRATVITDFSNLEEIGKAHYMNLHEGCVPAEELENLDGVETAHLLIRDNPGTVTPYGVVYDNGMKLEPLYTGGAFPPYPYDPCPLALEASPLSEPEDTKNTTILCLPMTEKQLERTLARGGIDSMEQVRIKLDTAFLEELSSLPNLERERLNNLNEMCGAIMRRPYNELPKLSAAITLAQPQCAVEVKHLAENLELFDFIPKVKTPAEYGRYMIEESGHFEYDPNLEGFYDFEGYARQRISHEQGQFVEDGYISYHGTLTLDELMQDDPAEQYQKEQSFQMGGMQ